MSTNELGMVANNKANRNRAVWETNAKVKKDRPVVRDNRVVKANSASRAARRIGREREQPRRWMESKGAHRLWCAPFIRLKSIYEDELFEKAGLARGRAGGHSCLPGEAPAEFKINSLQQQLFDGSKNSAEVKPQMRSRPRLLQFAQQSQQMKPELFIWA